MPEWNSQPTIAAAQSTFSLRATLFSPGISTQQPSQRHFTQDTCSGVRCSGRGQGHVTHFYILDFATYKVRRMHTHPREKKT